MVTERLQKDNIVGLHGKIYLGHYPNCACVQIRGEQGIAGHLSAGQLIPRRNRLERQLKGGGAA